MKKLSRIFARRNLIAALLLLSVSVSSQLRSDIHFENRKQSLNVLVLEQSLTYQKRSQLQTGLEFEALHKFADDFGYQLKVVPARSTSDLKNRMKSSEIDIVAGRINDMMIDSNNLDWQKSFSYDSDRLALVCKSSSRIEFPSPSSLKQNSKIRISVIESNVFQKQVPTLKNNFSNASFRYLSPNASHKIYADFVRSESDCLLSFQLEAVYYKKIFTQLEIVKEFHSEHPFYFLVTKSKDTLLEDLNKWISLSSKRNWIDNLKRQVSGRHLPLREADYENFSEARTEILPDLLPIFLKYAKQFSLPWELLAAVAYQESHWNNEATSFTGVRGIMQITAETAEYLGLEDRLNVEQSISAAFKYIRLLYDRTPKYLPSKERAALALATYNVGPAHMIDAQNLAIHLGKNPYSWNDLKNILPLLSSDEFVGLLKYGKARGEEPVQFVNFVFAYFEVLKFSI